MALLEDLIDDISDPQLRQRIAKEVASLKRQKKFGLVFEGHEPELVTVRAFVRVGSRVTNRKRPDDQSQYTVRSISDNDAKIESDDGDIEEVPLDDLLVVKRFGDPIFPGLTSMGSVGRSDDKPAHAVINGENFHALHALLASHGGKVDVIYIDPPYNTGDKSWKYNNRFVDENDGYGHSKWLSFMEKRLKLAKGLLKRDGVLIVTIDEHEVHRLGVLLQDLFPEARQQMVTIVINAAGVQQGGFYRVEEHALFCFFGGASPSPGPDDYLADEGRSKRPPIWRPLNRYSGTNVSAEKRPGLVYPVFVNVESERIQATGVTLAELRKQGSVSGPLNDWRPPSTLDETPESCVALWPWKGDGSMATWEVNPETLMDLVEAGFARVNGRGDRSSPSDFSVSYVKAGNRRKVKDGEIEVLGREDGNGPLILGKSERHVVPKTVWRRSKHDAGKWGKRALREMLGSAPFDFPKSPYAVFDALAPIVRDRPEAIVVDFFAGSGTTLQATAMLNATDDGRRQCILVTNNDLSDADARAMHAEGKFKGDLEYEEKGIFESVARPRIEAAVTGRRPDGTPVEGDYGDAYLEDYAQADGFSQHVEFFRLDYLDHDVIELGGEYDRVVPLLWLRAGGVGEWEPKPDGKPWSAPESSTYAALFDAGHITDFVNMLEAHGRISHVWVETRSQSVFKEVRALVPSNVEYVGILYGDYLRDVVQRPRKALA